MADLIKKTLIVGIIGIIFFPVIFLTFMFVDGQLRIEKGKITPDSDNLKVEKYSPIQDSMAVINSKIFQANILQEERLKREKKQILAREKRLQILQEELEKTASQIEKDKSKIKKLVKTSRVGEQKRIKALSKIYGSMRAAEAAPILETLSDELVISILNAITENRQKAKILEKMNTAKASRISKIMGMPILKDK